MRLILLCVIFGICSGTFINPYPRFQLYNDDGNPGEALYLTKYIESGDIETVSWFSSYFSSIS